MSFRSTRPERPWRCRERSCSTISSTMAFSGLSLHTRALLARTTCWTGRAGRSFLPEHPGSSCPLRPGRVRKAPGADPVPECVHRGDRSNQLGDPRVEVGLTDRAAAELGAEA